MSRIAKTVKEVIKKHKQSMSKLITEEEIISVIEKKCASACIHSLYLKGVIKSSIEGVLEIIEERVNPVPSRLDIVIGNLSLYRDNQIKTPLKSIFLNHGVTYHEWVELRSEGHVDWMTDEQFIMVASLYENH